MDQSLGEDAGFVMPATTSALDRYDAARKETT